MKKNLIYLLFAIVVLSVSCKNMKTAPADGESAEMINLDSGKLVPEVLIVDFTKGKFHNHPLMAVWAEDLHGNYLETFFVAKSIGTGIFDKASGGGGKWLPGPVRRPAALPYWAFKRGVKEADGLYIPTPQTAIPDAIAGATPKSDFRLIAKPTLPNFPKVFNLLFEINQSWDWNQYWTNSMFPDEPEYKTSSQPSLILSVRVNLDKKDKVLFLNPIGHGHYSGKNGELFTDVSTLTTALEIAQKITVTVKSGKGR
jgi:hypothetical protein